FKEGGSLDTNFGGGDGIVYTDFNGGLDYPAAVAVDGSNRILLGGCAGTVPGAESNCDDFGLARYLSNGKLDTSFGGGDGKVETDFHGGADYAYGMALMPNGDVAPGAGSRPRTAARSTTASRCTSRAGPSIRRSG